MKPIIAILGAVDDDKTVTLQNTYTRAIEAAGGLPLIIPYTENEESIAEYVKICDGFLFSGGCDIEPRKFGEDTLPECGKIQLYRDYIELEIFKRAFDEKKPIMGICRGIQLINVALGGTLYQNIPTQISTDIPHRQTEAKNQPSHSVKIFSDTPLMELISKERMTANSFHHQSIKSLGEGLEVMALADDGIIEAIYRNGENYILGYQWHPERLFDTDADNKALFDDFISACIVARKE
jgi:putative glutamine amidotransferase